jgi:hypothetical protein
MRGCISGLHEEGLTLVFSCGLSRYKNSPEKE